MPEMSFNFDVEEHRWLQWHVNGLPEIRLFPTRHQRDGAVKRVGRQFWTRAPLRLVIGGCLSLLLLYVLFELCRRTGYRVLEIPLGLLWIPAAWALTSWLIRPAMAKGLREELNRIGVPVCLDCGAALPTEADSSVTTIALCTECDARLRTNWRR